MNQELAEKKRDTADEVEPRLDANVSLIRGGPFYQAQLKTRLIFPKAWNLGRRILALVAVGWIPMVLLTAVLQPQSLIPLLTDYRIASRLLIAIPVLLVGQVLMESRFRTIVAQIRALLLDPEDMPQLDSVLSAIIRMRDSVIPELVILILVYVHVALSLGDKTGLASTWALQAAGGTSGVHPSTAAWYYVLVGQPMYQFLLALSLWKWLLWSYFLFKLSRMKLQLAISHPDQHAGLGFLAMSVQAFSPIAFAIAAAVGATWRYDILSAGAHISSFKLPGIALFIVTIMIAIGPLAIFVPRLAALKRRGVLEYGGLAHLQSSEFHEKWILHRHGNEEDILAAPEVSTLTDLAASFQNVEKVKPFLFDKGSIVALGLALIIPILPAITAEIPLKVILKSLLSAIK